MPNTAFNRKLKVITFALIGVNFECQLTSWKMINNTPDGERFYTYCPNGEFFEEAEPDYALELKFLSDWRPGGISDFLVANDQALAGFVLDNHPDIVGEHVRWSGDCKLKAPDAGGDVRITETQEVTLPVIGKPLYARL